jgi:2-oxoglutarate dehydrogenase E1 component
MKRSFRKPLILMTPKSLLRHKEAVSSLEDLAHGKFHMVLPDQANLDADNVTRVIMCAGKVYYDLVNWRAENERDDTAIIRLEQLYPFPKEELLEVLQAYANVEDIVWCQEEPQNQGAWYCSQHHFIDAIPQDAKLKYAGRKASASPACGYMSVHTKEQQALVADALTIEKKG